MASAIIGGCVKHGVAGDQILAIDPNADQLAKLRETWGVRGATEANDELKSADLVVWAVKPQVFKSVALNNSPFCGEQALHLSVAAGVTCTSLASCLGSSRWVRAMPNTPALVGAGATALFALPEVSVAERTLVADLLASTGLVLWVDDEALLEAVTAVSGSGPAYVFYWLEAMLAGGADLGLDPAAAKQLAIATLKGAALLAEQSEESPATLRERVTSKGGATHEALEVMRAGQVDATIQKAMHACAQRARELGAAFDD